MKFFSFDFFFSKPWQQKKGKRPRRSSRRTPASRLMLEALEDRTLLSVLPPPLVSGQGSISGGIVSGSIPPLPPPPADNSPMVVVDPVNAQKVVAVYSQFVGGF